MLKNLRKVLQLMEPAERFRSYVLLAMVLVMALLDTIGVGSVLPFVAVLSDPNAVTNNHYLTAIYQIPGFYRYSIVPPVPGVGSFRGAYRFRRISRLYDLRTAAIYEHAQLFAESKIGRWVP